MSYTVSEIWPADRAALRQMDALLTREGIARDQNLDYMCGLYDEQGRLAATGSCFRNMVRCLAVDRAHQGEGLLNQVLSHLLTKEAERGYTHLFLHTKPDAAFYLRDLGFYEIARTRDVVFMENRKDGFARYLASLGKPEIACADAAAVVMNANPFTLGHQYLVETAAAQCGVLHLFVVSEDTGPIPAAVRRQLVEAGTAHIPNVILHDCGPYMISFAAFPSYFLKETDRVIGAQAQLDLQVFLRIAQTLGITARYVGEEPASRVTGIYNRTRQ